MSEQLALPRRWMRDCMVHDKHERTPLALTKSFISPVTNCGPWSATISSGYPCIANKPRRAVIVEPALVEDIGTISILDFASTTIRNIPLLKGPAKSTCKRCRGRLDNLWQSVRYRYPNLATRLAVLPRTSFAPFLDGLGVVPTTLPVDTWMVLLL